MNRPGRWALKRREWQSVRHAVLERDGWACRTCRPCWSGFAGWSCWTCRACRALDALRALQSLWTLCARTATAHAIGDVAHGQLAIGV